MRGARITGEWFGCTLFEAQLAISVAYHAHYAVIPELPK